MLALFANHMRILGLMPDCLDHPMGGLGEQCRQLIEAFEMRCPETHFDVIGSREQREAQGPNYSYAPVDEIPVPLGNLWPLVGNLTMQLPLFATAVTHLKPDLVHAFDWSSFTAGVYLARHWRVPLVATVQLSVQQLIDDGVVQAEENRPVWDANIAAEFQGLLHAAAIIHVSRAYAARFPRLFDPKSHIVGNGIDLNQWQPHSKPALPGSGTLKLVYIGRFDWMKNIVALLDARLPDNVDLIFVGGNRGGIPSLQDAVIKAAATRPNVHYLGPKYGQEKVDVLCAADAVIMPSLHEPFGIVALEALASRSILLSSFRGGMADFLTQDVAVDCGVKSQEISVAIEKVVLMAAEERARRVEAGLAICRSYSWGCQAERLASIYTNVLAEARRTAVTVS